jgi:hypothetical protein
VQNIVTVYYVYKFNEGVFVYIILYGNGYCGVVVRTPALNSGGLRLRSWFGEAILTEFFIVFFNFSSWDSTLK